MQKFDRKDFYGYKKYPFIIEKNIILKSNDYLSGN